MKKIFISYNRESKESAKKLAESLASMRFDAWYDHELSGGQVWWNEILQSIRNCDVFIFLLSVDSLNSEACKREWGYAEALGKCILPVLIDKEVNLNLLPPALAQQQFVDATQEEVTYTISLVASLNTLNSPILPDPLPSEPEAPVSYLGELGLMVGQSELLDQKDQNHILLTIRRSIEKKQYLAESKIILERLIERTDCLLITGKEANQLLNRIQSLEVDTVKTTDKVTQQSDEEVNAVKDTKHLLNTKPDLQITSPKKLELDNTNLKQNEVSDTAVKVKRTENHDKAELPLQNNELFDDKTISQKPKRSSVWRTSGFLLLTMVFAIVSYLILDYIGLPFLAGFIALSLWVFTVSIFLMLKDL